MTAEAGRILWWSGLVLALLPTLLLRYLTFPVPGSQRFAVLPLTRWLWRFRFWPMTLGLTLAAAGAGVRLTGPGSQASPGLLALLALPFLLLLVFLERHSPQHLFRRLTEPRFTRGEPGELAPDRLVLGVARATRGRVEAAAYPLYMMSYHHYFEDTLGGETILPTYCGLCRSGRVFLPRAAGRQLSFTVVGIQQTNSILEDHQTGSWWQQATGRAIAGPLAGEVLEEIPVEQMRLDTWLELYPEARVLQPDTATGRRYRLFGIHRIDHHRDDPEGAPGLRWMVTVRDPDVPRDGAPTAVLPWSELVRDGVLQGDLEGDGLPYVVRLAADGQSFRAWDRRLGGRVLELRPAGDDTLLDPISGTRFGFDGVGRGGESDGARLRPLLAQQEMRHSVELSGAG